MNELEKQLSRIGNKTLCPTAVIVRDKKVLMGLRHYTPDKWKNISVWTCPGGRCDDGESIKATLVREVYEETGIDDLKITGYLGEVLGVKEGDFVPMFLCETNQDARLMEPNKFSEWKYFDLNEFPDNYINNDARLVIQSFFEDGKNR